VISDNGDHLFRPNDPMTRDFYVSLAVGVGCKKCETPSASDIMRYQNSPFVDLSKMNPYYYCIAYAADEGITQGYPINTSGVASCEKSTTSYTSPPFCGNNSISRIEAVAILLRRANLWNENLNSANFEKTLTITDVSSYWFGYAQK
jgi:S-layer homology domain